MTPAAQRGKYSCSFTRSQRVGQCQAQAALRPGNSLGAHPTGGLSAPLDRCEKSKQAYVYYDNNNFNLIYIRIQKFVFFSLFSINIFCIVWIVTNWFKAVSLFSTSMVPRLINNFFIFYGIRALITVVSGAYTWPIYDLHPELQDLTDKW